MTDVRTLTDATLDGLRNAASLMKQGQDDAAQSVLTALQPSVATLIRVSKVMQASAESDSATAQQSLSALLQKMAEANQRDADIRTAIGSDNARIADLSTNLRCLADSIGQYNDEMIRLKIDANRIDADMEEKREKANDFGWVPGYGQYLVADYLKSQLDGTVQRMDALIETINDLSARVPSLQSEESVLGQELVGLNNQLSDLYGERARLGEQVNASATLQEQQAGLVASLGLAASFYADLSASLDGVEDGLSSTYNFIDRLAEPAEVLSSDGRLVTGTLTDALFQLADKADAAGVGA